MRCKTSPPEKMHPADPAYGERTHSARECAIDCAQRKGVKSKAVLEDAVLHVGYAYRVCGICLSKRFCNPGLDECVHKGIREEQESQNAEEHYCSNSKAHIQRPLQRRQITPVR